MTGSLEVGKAVDFIVLDLNALAFTPRNKLPYHLVYAETGSSIGRVAVGGLSIFVDGHLTGIGERGILAGTHRRASTF